MSSLAIAGLVFSVLGLMALGLLIRIVLFHDLYNSPDGERFRRMQAGPFIPLSSEDIAEDEQRRISRRKSAN